MPNVTSCTAWSVCLADELQVAPGGTTFDRTCSRVFQFGTSGFERGNGVAIDSSANVLVVGSTTGALPGNLSSGGQDAFLRKYDAAGTVTWTRQFGGLPDLLLNTGNTDSAEAVAVDGSGNIYVAGFTEGAMQAVVGGRDAFIQKFSAAGAVLWARQFGSTSDDQATALAVDAFGDVLVAGYTFGALPGQVSAGNYDAFLRKYDTNGNIVWTRQFGTAGFDAVTALAVVGSDQPVVTGSTFGALGVLTAGGRDVFVRKFNALGAALWTSQVALSSAGDESSAGVAVDASGNLYVTGSTDGALQPAAPAGGRDAFVVKLDQGGARLWTRQFGTNQHDDAHAVAVDASGQVVIVGETLGTLPGQVGAGSADVFVRRYDPLGAVLWTGQYGSSGIDTARGVAATSNAFIVGDVVGQLPGQVGEGNSDAFLVRLAP